MHSPKTRQSRTGKPAHGFDFKHNGTELRAWGGPAYIFAAVLAIFFALLLAVAAIARAGWLLL